MEKSNSLSNMRSSLGRAAQTMPPAVASLAHAFPTSYFNSCNINIKNINNNVEVSSEATQNPMEGHSLLPHQQVSSKSFLHHQVEQPSWFEDLLKEPDQSMLLNNKCHRRSSSDSSAYFCLLANKTTPNSKTQENNFTNRVNNNARVPCWGSEDALLASINDPRQTASAGNNKSTSFVPSPAPEESEVLSSTSPKKHDDHNLANAQNRQVSTEGNEASQTKPSLSKAETKHAKQQSAHRSRVRKLQYIAELERNMEVLQIEGTEVSAQLEFLEQQNLILTMENRALRQRLESLSQGHLIKQLEQDMLEREIARLQTLYQLQLHHQHQQHRQYPKHRRNNRSREHLDVQYANLP